MVCLSDIKNYNLHIARRFNESLANGIPVIISDHAIEMKKIVKKFECGFIYKESDSLSILWKK